MSLFYHVRSKPLLLTRRYSAAPAKHLAGAKLDDSRTNFDFLQALREAMGSQEKLISTEQVAKPESPSADSTPKAITKKKRVSYGRGAKGRAVRAYPTQADIPPRTFSGKLRHTFEERLKPPRKKDVILASERAISHHHGLQDDTIQTMHDAMEKTKKRRKKKEDDISGFSSPPHSPADAVEEQWGKDGMHVFRPMSWSSCIRMILQNLLQQPQGWHLHFWPSWNLESGHRTNHHC
jgi:hypothetical protein